MPELPEVETVARDLRPLLVGRTITAVRAGPKRLRQKWSRAWAGRMCGRQVESIGRRGKWLLIHLDHGVAVVHLGMTGQLTVGPRDRPIEPHTHLFFELDDGGQLRFRDVRRFGGVTLFDDAAGVDKFLNGKLGPEPFDLPKVYWRTALAKTRRCLKAVLLDQRVVAGVGNIYADEALFVARLRPARLGTATSPREADRLRRAIAAVLLEAVDARGSSIRDYIGGSGERGNYQTEFRVYGRPAEPCPRCRTPIARIRLAGRSTHFCERCQR